MTFPLASGDYFGVGHHAGCGAQPDTQHVVQIQELINNKNLLFAIQHGQGGTSELTVDGCFGGLTKTGVIWWQGQVRTVQDGKVGALTWASLGL